MSTDSNSRVLSISITGWLFNIPPNSNNTYENPNIWLQKLYDFVENSKDDDAIDLLFDNIDDLLIDHRIDLCEEILNIINLEKLNSNLLIGLLSITNSAKTYLPTRTKIISDIEKIFKKTESPERIEGLLKGLY